MNNNYKSLHEKMRNLKEHKKFLATYMEIIEDIENGIPERRTCADHDVNVMEFRRFLAYKRVGFTIDFVDSTDDKVMANILSGYEKLYLEVMRHAGYKMGHNCNRLDLSKIPYDADETMKELIRTLPKREAKILTMNCNGRSLADIGREFDLTRSRIQQLRAKAINRLTSQNRYKVLVYGKSAYNQILNARKKYIDNVEVGPKVLEIESKATAYADAKDLTALKELRESLNNYISDLESSGAGCLITPSTDIDKLNLSVRPYNCFRRANIRTVADLMTKSRSDLMKIRNLGCGSLEEIVSKCKELNIPLKEED